MKTRHDPLYHIVCISLEDDLRDFNKESVPVNELTVRFRGHPALKDTIESIGVPQVEIGKTEKDRENISLELQLHGGERIKVFPKKYFYEGESSPSGYEVLLPTPPRFILDGHLGKLAVKMRMAGIDTDYETQRSDARIVDEAQKEDRIVLTRDIGLLKHKILKYGRWIRSDNPLDQWIEVTRFFRLWYFFNPGIRCTNCNTVLNEVPFEDVADQVPKLVRERRPEIKRCPSCGHLYWRGTHFQNFVRELEDVIKQARG